VRIPFLTQQHCFMMAQLVCIGPAVQAINNIRMLAVLLEATLSRTPTPGCGAGPPTT